MIRIPFQFVYYAKLKSWLSEFLLIVVRTLLQSQKKSHKKVYCTLSEKRLLTPRFFPSLWFQSAHTEKCRSSKIPRGFLKVAAAQYSGHIFMSRAKFHSSQQSRLKIFISHLMIHLGENVWFNINQPDFLYEKLLTYFRVYLSDLKMQISKCKISSLMGATTWGLWLMELCFLPLPDYHECWQEFSKALIRAAALVLWSNNSSSICQYPAEDWL